MDFQVAKIIHIMVRGTAEEESQGHSAETEILGESDSQVWAGGFPLVWRKLGSWLTTFNQGHSLRKHPEEDENR